MAATSRKQEDKIVDAALSLAAKRGWRGLSLAEIASEAKVPLAKLYRLYPTREHVLGAFLERIDLLALEDKDAEPDPDEAPRDRLFDAIMRRFDALLDYRDGVRAIYFAMRRDPIAMLSMRRALLRSLSWIIEDAGLSASGAVGALRVRGIAPVVHGSFRVWLDDDESDFAKTMADLDRRLRRVESIVETFRHRGSKRNVDSEDCVQASN